MRRRIAVIVALLLAVAAAATGSELSVDLSARRARAMEQLGPDAMLILWSASPVRYSPDINYEYRQDSNLYYLTGVTQPDTMLVLMPGNSARREILFVTDRNAAQERWTGPLLGAAEAAAFTGIDTVLPAAEFEPFVAAMLGRRPYGAVTASQAARFFDALDSGRAHVAVALDPATGIGDPLPPPLAFAKRLRDRFVGFTVTDAAPILTDLRLVKTPYEQQVLARTFDISNDAQRAGMRASHPGAYEYEVRAAIEASIRGRGAAPAYPPIVGSGPDATIIHYAGGGRRMENGDLLLVDAAGSLEYLSGDITRTYPVGGTFSAAQRDIYDIVLDAQNAGIRASRPGATLLDVYTSTVDVIKAGLLKLGLITDVHGEQYRIWYPHGSSHFIGIDVHDVGDASRPLAPGMTFTIEPGLYITQAALDALPRTAENAAFIAQVQPAVRRYENIGVRIEDSFLLDEGGLRALSAGVPKTIDQIEAFLRRPPAAAAR